MPIDSLICIYIYTYIYIYIYIHIYKSIYLGVKILSLFPCVDFIGNIPLFKAIIELIIDLHKEHMHLQGIYSLSLFCNVVGLDLLYNYTIFFNRLLWSISTSSTSILSIKILSPIIISSSIFRKKFFN